MENEKDGGIHISGVTGEVSGVIQGGTGNIAGKYVVVGTGTINASEQQLTKIPDDYANALRKFSENINKQLEGSQIPQEQIESIKQSMSSGNCNGISKSSLYCYSCCCICHFLDCL
jgi:hypothetical protein